MIESAKVPPITNANIGDANLNIKLSVKDRSVVFEIEELMKTNDATVAIVDGIKTITLPRRVKNFILFDSFLFVTQMQDVCLVEIQQIAKF